MKNTMRSLHALFLAAILVFSLAACAVTEAPAGLWENAVYQEDTVLGEGAKTVVVEVAAEEKTVTFTVHTDETTVGAALLAHGLIAGDESEYGLYVKVVNGITADYDVDQSYWGFYIDGEYAMTGVDSIEITEGAVYRLVYTK